MSIEKKKKGASILENLDNTASVNKHPTNIYSKGRLTKSKPAFAVSTHTTNIKK